MTTLALVAIITICAPCVLVVLALTPLALDTRRGLKNWE